MENCPICGASLRQAVVVCGGCGEDLPLQVVVVSEGSRGGGVVLVDADLQREEVNESREHR